MIGVMKTPVYGNQLEVTSLQGHNQNITSLNWSSNDQFLLSSSADKSCIVWNLNWQKKGEKLLVLDKIKATKTGESFAEKIR